MLFKHLATVHPASTQCAMLRAIRQEQGTLDSSCIMATFKIKTPDHWFVRALFGSNESENRFVNNAFLEEIAQNLIEKHPMLRARFFPDQDQLKFIVEEVDGDAFKVVYSDSDRMPGFHPDSELSGANIRVICNNKTGEFTFVVSHMCSDGHSATKVLTEIATELLLKKLHLSWLKKAIPGLSGTAPSTVEKVTEPTIKQQQIIDHLKATPTIIWELDAALPTGKLPRKPENTTPSPSAERTLKRKSSFVQTNVGAGDLGTTVADIDLSKVTTILAELKKGPSPISISEGQFFQFVATMALYKAIGENITMRTARAARGKGESDTVLYRATSMLYGLNIEPTDTLRDVITKGMEFWKRMKANPGFDLVDAETFSQLMQRGIPEVGFNYLGAFVDPPPPLPSLMLLYCLNMLTSDVKIGKWDSQYYKPGLELSVAKHKDKYRFHVQNDETVTPELAREVRDQTKHIIDSLALDIDTPMSEVKAQPPTVLAQTVPAPSTTKIIMDVMLQLTIAYLQSK